MSIVARTVGTLIAFGAILLLCAAPAHGAMAEAAKSTAGLDGWLERYERAWETRDSTLAASLFSTDATYHEMPFDAPLRGNEAIGNYWRRVTDDQRDIDFQAKPIAMAGDTGVAEWTARFRSESSGAVVELNGVFVLKFDSNGSCTSLREWWHVRQK